MAIQRLNQGTASLADSVPIYDPINGRDRRISLNDVLDLFQTQLTTNGGFLTQYSSPASSGFTVTVAPFVEGGSVWLKLTPSGAFAAGTITLPATPVDGQEVVVSCRTAVTVLTVNGGTVYGAPTTLAANAFFRLRYDGVESTWNRVG